MRILEVIFHPLSSIFVGYGLNWATKWIGADNIIGIVIGISIFILIGWSAYKLSIRMAKILETDQVI